MDFVALLILAAIFIPYFLVQFRLWRECRIPANHVDLTSEAANEVLFETETILTVEYHRYISEGNRGFKPPYPPKHDPSDSPQPTDFPFGPEFP